MLSQLLIESYRHWTGEILAPDAESLCEAPFPVVAHGTEPDPIFCYANRAALTLWEMTLEDFTKLPSRQSAEAVTDIQTDRSRLLASAMQNGWIADYRGIRISASGRRFEISDTILWNVIDAQGNLHGQAARIGNWRWID